MKNVKEFIDEIARIDGVNFLDRDKFIQDYIKKIEDLAERKDKKIDTQFLEENLKRNVKYVVYVEYTEEEKALAEEVFEAIKNVRGNTKEEREYERRIIKEELIKNSPVGESYMKKQETGARPGQYIQGRIVISNMSDYDEILREHETTHAARMQIFDKNGKCIEPNFDELEAVTESDKFLQQFPSSTATAGYDFGEFNKNGDSINLPHQYEMMQLMEICTESIAGMINETADEKKFAGGKFSVPTSKMSAITYMEKNRNLLIMAIGSDDFIFDMLKENRKEGLEKLKGMMRYYKKDLWDYLKIYDDRKLEQYATEIFKSRIRDCKDQDKSEQIDYFSSLLQTKELKDELNQLKNRLESNLKKSSDLEKLAYRLEESSKGKTKFYLSDVEFFLQKVASETAISGFTRMTQNVKNTQKTIEQEKTGKKQKNNEKEGWNIDDNQ